MKDFRKCEEILGEWGPLMTKWMDARKYGTNNMRKEVLRRFPCLLYYKFDGYVPDVMKTELIEICQSPGQMQEYFDVWLYYVGKLCRDLPIPDEWDVDKFSELPEETQEAWCEAHDEVSVLPTFFAGVVVRLIKKYGLSIKRDIPGKLSAEIAALQDTQTMITDGVGHRLSDEEESHEKAQKKSNREFREYMCGDDADERLKNAKAVRGNGRDALREILTICFPSNIADYPPYPEFCRVFGERVCKSEYHVILKEKCQLPKKPKKL